MHTAPILPLPKLLAPIDGEDPAGPDLRTDPTASRAFQALKHGRTSARSAERQIAMGGEEASAARPNWKPVLDLGCRVIADQSKDLEVAAYMVEALARLHGFAGLRDGFRLCHGLVRGFWEGLHPRPDEDGLATRVAPLMVLNGEGVEGTLIVPILNIPLTSSSNSGPFGCSQYENAQRTERIGDASARKRRIDRGAIGLKQFLEAVSESSSSFYARLAAEIDECIEEFTALVGLMDGLCGDQSPHSSNIRNALQSCRDAVHNFAGEKIRLASALNGNGISRIAASLPESFGDEPESGMPPHSDPWEGPARGISEAIPSREHALLMIQEIADFFRRTEPHSPLPYALDQAVRWGRTPLPQLLEELIPDPLVKQHYFRLVGIPPSSGDS